MPNLGPNGAAIAQAVTLTVSNGARLWLVWRFVRIQPFGRAYAKLTIPAAAGLAVMVGTHLLLRNAAWSVDLIVTGVTGTVAYVAVLLTTALSPTERAAMRRLLGRSRPAANG